MQAKPYPRTKPSGVEWLGDIAQDWTVSSIKHLVSTPVTDGPHETPEISDDGIPFVSAEAVSGGRINFEKIRGHITVEDHKRFSRKYKPQRGDIYLIKSGATTGRVAMVETDIEFNIWSPLAAIRCDPKQADRNFLFFYMQSKEFQTAVELSWSFGTQQNIGMGVIQNLAVPLPSLPEQRAIAAFLDRETGRLDTLVAKNRELLERLKEQRTALIARAVTRGLNLEAKLKPSGIEWLGEIPEHWKATKVGYYISILSGFAFPSTGFTHDDTDTRLLRGINVGVSEIRWDETVYWNRSEGDGLDAFNLKAGTLVIGMDRPWIRDGARVAIITEKDLPCLLLQRVAAIKPSRHLCRDYLFRILSSPIFVDYFTPDMTGVSVPHISPDQINNFPIPIPPLHEQQAIAAYLDAETAKLDALAAKVGEAIERLQEYRTALITAAVTGKIDVRKSSHVGNSVI